MISQSAKSEPNMHKIQTKYVHIQTNYAYKFKQDTHMSNICTSVPTVNVCNFKKCVYKYQLPPHIYHRKHLHRD